MPRREEYSKFTDEQKERAREYARRYYWAHREERIAYQKNLDPAHRQKRTQKYRKILRDEVYEHYGNKCACCGETERRFLSIDHINGRGRERRQNLAGTSGNGSNLSLLLDIRKNWPDDIQILCFNCNGGRAPNGGICPHEEVA
jgi:hypothetical protein